MNIHGCTMLACMGEELFEIQVLEGRLHDLPLWVEECIIMNMDYHILYQSDRKNFYLFMDWMGRYINIWILKGVQSWLTLVRVSFAFVADL